jgi:hypothetical protein
MKFLLARAHRQAHRLRRNKPVPEGRPCYTHPPAKAGAHLPAGTSGGNLGPGFRRDCGRPRFDASRVGEAGGGLIRTITVFLRAENTNVHRVGPSPGGETSTFWTSRRSVSLGRADTATRSRVRASTALRDGI